jgi:hypothetical protein
MLAGTVKLFKNSISSLESSIFWFFYFNRPPVLLEADIAACVDYDSFRLEQAFLQVAVANLESILKARDGWLIGADIRTRL